VNKIVIFFILIFLTSGCSFNKNSKFWTASQNIPEESNPNYQEIFAEEEALNKELNANVSISLGDIFNNNSKVRDYFNNDGRLDYDGILKKSSRYKFSKIKNFYQFEPKISFNDNNLVFFDNKGSILKFDDKSKLIWKKNYYSKSEKKLKPKLNFLLDGQNLLVTDSIAKYYSVNISTGELNWSKNNDYPFNSNIKKHKDKIFVIDYKNTLRCFKIKDGSECWNLQTEDSFTISNIKYSLIILNDNVIFNNSIGDITAVDIETGLITWQLPTQSSSIINETYNFKTSKLVSDGNSVFFSNNKNQFYSIDLKTGTTNWINEVNSNVKPILVGNLIFTISNEGYLYLIDKNKGNIVRITDLFLNYKDKKRKNIYPIGFVIGDKNVFLTNSDGKMIIARIEDGKIIKIEKVSGGLVSEPFIFNNNLYVVRNGSIVQYN